MDQRVYVAHITEDGRCQTVKEHLEGTSVRCAAFAGAFGAEDAGRLAGLLHDIGKYSEGFQKRILHNGSIVDHASAGAIECYKRHPYAAMCVMGHHGGLPDLGVFDDTADAPTFYGRYKRYSSTQAYRYDAYQNEITLPEAKIPDLRSLVDASFYTRMLYSCLVDADFLDTASFMGAEREGVCADWEVLNARLDAYIKGWYPPQGALNRARCAILDTCLSVGETNARSLYTLTVPTGGGKTVASLAFALRHAKAQGKERIIYVIPYTSIIEQTAEVFRNILGSDAVLEHHNGMTFDEDHELTERQKRLKYASENWDMPIIVTTAVQFFESLYSNRPSRCRKLHNIANSVVIFDEAQMLPLVYLRPCAYAIAELTRAYRVTAVLCTATQPALAPIFAHFLQKDASRVFYEICPEDLKRDDMFRRVTFHKTGKLSLEALAAHLNAQKQVLCIVNTRAAAQEVYALLEEEGRFHLSTLMHPDARQKQLARIRERLQQGLRCRVVSTSLIEAGVDVDFPTVFRELAGLDSVLQAAGRCNREGKCPREESCVYVFSSEWKTPPSLEVAVGVCRSVLERGEDLMCEDVIRRYFEAYLFFKGEEAQDSYRILKRLVKSTLPFAEVARDFHLIDSCAVTVYIPTAESYSLIDQYRNGCITRSLMRKLGRFGVTVYPNDLKKLLDAGDVEVLPGDVYVLVNENLYSEDMGLSIQIDQGKAIFI